MRQEHEILVGARNEMLHSNWWCLSVILEPRLGGCVDHTIDPKLKQTDLICGTSSGFRSSKVASFVSVACYQISRQLENGYAPKTYMQEFLRRFPAPWKCFLVRHDKHIHDTWTVVLEWRAPLHWCLCAKLCPTKFRISPMIRILHVCVIFASFVTSNLSNISVLSHTSSNHKGMIIVEARGKLLLFKPGPVRIEALSLAIHELKVLQDSWQRW